MLVVPGDDHDHDHYHEDDCNIIIAGIFLSLHFIAGSAEVLIKALPGSKSTSLSRSSIIIINDHDHYQ